MPLMLRMGQTPRPVGEEELSLAINHPKDERVGRRQLYWPIPHTNAGQNNQLGNTYEAPGNRMHKHTLGENLQRVQPERTSQLLREISRLHLCVQ